MSKSKQKQVSPEGPVLQIDAEVTRCIRQHARAFMKTEVCGVLIGEERDGVIEVQASIEASNAAQAGTHVTFTQDAWEEIYRVKDQKYSEHRIVGWYHSHPGFGVFLSEHDTFIHRNFFSSPNQVAWVYDPHTDEEGCFGWFKDEIHRIPSFATIDESGDGEERTPRESAYAAAEDDGQDEDAGISHARRRTPAPERQKQSLPMLAMNIVAYLGMAIVGFAACFFLFPPRLVGVAIDRYTMEPMTVEGKPVLVELPQNFQLSNSPVLVPSQTPVGQPANAAPAKPATQQSTPPTAAPPAKSAPTPEPNNATPSPKQGNQPGGSR